MIRERKTTGWSWRRIRNFFVDLLCLNVAAIYILFAECFEERVK